MKTDRKIELFFYWFLATLFGAFFGVIFGGLIGFLIPAEFQYAYLAKDCLVFSFLGLGTGFMQRWFVLEERIDHSGWWIVATVLGSLAFAIARFYASYSGYTEYLLAGLVLGTAQWLVLRRSLRRAHWWLAFRFFCGALVFPLEIDLFTGLFSGLLIAPLLKSEPAPAKEAAF